MRTWPASVALLVLLVGVSLDAHAAGGVLRIGGTGTAMGMLEQVGAEFTAASGVKVAFVPNLGSSGAMRALGEGRLDIAVIARPLRGAESTAGFSQVHVLRAAYVMATSRRHPNDLKSSELAGIYKAANATWADGAPIRIILRPRSDTDTELLGELFPGMRDALEAARLRPEIPTAATDQDNAELAERIQGSLTGTTATQIKTERRRLEMVPLDGVAPTFTNFESGAYRYAKKLYFIAPANNNGDVVRFVDFLRSPPGLKALRETEVLPEGQ